MSHPALLDRKTLLASLILLLLIVLICGAMGVYVMSDPGIVQALTLTRAALTIADQYGYDAVSRKLIASARRAIFDRLDRYSGYIDASDFNRLDEEFTGRYGGIGVRVVRHEKGLLIMSVRENGPADDAGLLTGDIIIGADSLDFEGISFDSAANLLRGEEGTSVLVRFIRSPSDTLEVKITRRQIPLTHVAYAGITPDSLLYIRLLDFEAGASAELKAALDSLLTDSAALRGLILDLRGNPGGLFTEAYESADLFLTEGTFIVGTDARSRWNEKRYYAGGEDVTEGLPMAVIVDRGSASSAEIVAGALKQAGRAVLVGDTTFGKGLVQGFIRFPDGDGLRLTIARYYFADSLFLNELDTALNDIGHGLAPDYYFESVETEPFPLALENSLLLQQFVSVHQDEIIAAIEKDEFDNTWVKRFTAYARDNGFTYQSFVTRTAELFYAQAVEESSLPDLKKVADKIVKTANAEDRNQFAAYAGYIKMKLKELALERKYGTHRAYRDVIVRESPIIRFAAAVLAGEP
jgi:carboxyl-terminal processing protease